MWEDLEEVKCLDEVLVSCHGLLTGKPDTTFGGVGPLN